MTYGREDPGPGSFIHKLSLLQALDYMSSLMNAHEDVLNRKMIRHSSSIWAVLRKERIRISVFALHVNKTRPHK